MCSKCNLNMQDLNWRLVDKLQTVNARLFYAIEKLAERNMKFKQSYKIRSFSCKWSTGNRYMKNDEVGTRLCDDKLYELTNLRP